jgi:hypothetical protein
MDQVRKDVSTAKDHPHMCDRVSRQIIGMTFGEEKAYRYGTGKDKQAQEPRPRAGTPEPESD